MVFEFKISLTKMQKTAQFICKILDDTFLDRKWNKNQQYTHIIKTVNNFSIFKNFREKFIF